MRCSICDSSKVVEVERTGRILFQCSNGHERPTVKRGKEDLETVKFNSKRVPVKIASVIYTGDEIVMVKRKKFPYLYSLPFRHLKKDENLDSAVKEMVERQTGLEIDKPKQFEEVVLASRCWRSCEEHKWIFFKIETEREMLRIGKDADEVRWFNRKEIIQDLPTCDGTHYLYDHGYLNGLTVI